MARPERRETEPEATMPPPIAGGYQPGGHVGRIQADIADRLAAQEVARQLPGTPLDTRPGERAVRFLSVAGGYLALGAAYAGVVLLVMR